MRFLPAVMTTYSRLCSSFLVLFGLLQAGCGDKVTVKDAIDPPAPKGNATEVFDATGAAVDGQDITINRVRVLLSTDNADSPGVASIVDEYTLEVWATLSGEAKPQYVKMVGLLADADGNLYPASNEPGKVVVNNTIGSSLTIIPKDATTTYVVTATDAFVELDFPFYYELTDTTSANAGVDTTTTRTWLDPTTIASSPWAAIRNRGFSGTSSFTRKVLQENTGLATKGKVMCISKTADATANVAASAFSFGDVELGNILGNAANVDAVGGATTDVSGDDNTLWISWNDLWYITGFNVTSKTIRTVRQRSAPFYQNRELPAVDTTDTEPKLSGIESLIRTCNATAAKTGGSFSLASLSNSTLTVSSSNNYCQDLVDKITVGPKTVALNDTSFGGTCAWTGLPVTSGNWNGTSHSGTVTSAGSGSILHREHSAIVATVLTVVPAGK